jgi:hypothetical protein
MLDNVVRQFEDNAVKLKLNFVIEPVAKSGKVKNEFDVLVFIQLADKPVKCSSESVFFQLGGHQVVGQAAYLAIGRSDHLVNAVINFLLFL